MKPSRLLTVLLVAAAPVGVAACGSSSVSSGASGTSIAASTTADDLGDPVDLTGKKEVTIDVVDNAFTQKAIKVSPGTKVTWNNTGRNGHNVTPHDEGAFTFQDLPVGKTASVTFDKAGTYLYYCTIHSAKDRGPQRGKVVVAS